LSTLFICPLQPHGRLCELQVELEVATRGRKISALQSTGVSRMSASPETKAYVERYIPTYGSATKSNSKSCQLKKRSPLSASQPHTGDGPPGFERMTPSTASSARENNRVVDSSPPGSSPPGFERVKSRLFPPGYEPPRGAPPGSVVGDWMCGCCSYINFAARTYECSPGRSHTHTPPPLSLL
jgi:hypothetical protein